MFARVMMNRVWQYHFGQGLVKTPSDFGVRSGQPSHPELLDWLATEFAERKWSLKAIHKLLMTSDAYRRSSNVPETARQQDPANALLSHMSRRRLQAEEIRDSVLQVSGALNLKAGGMPVVPPLEAEGTFWTDWQTGKCLGRERQRGGTLPEKRLPALAPHFPTAHV